LLDLDELLRMKELGWGSSRRVPFDVHGGKEGKGKRGVSLPHALFHRRKETITMEKNACKWLPKLDYNKGRETV
jgi:hypothetical protein